MLKRPGRNHTRGLTLIELLIVVAIIGLLAAIAIPNLMSAQVKSRYARASADTKTATTQALVYQNDKLVGPGNMRRLRDNGYANIGNRDPWGKNWRYSAAFRDTASANQGEMGVCSRGVNNNGADCPANGWTLSSPPAPASNGGVGYSSIYASWQAPV